MKPLRGSLRGLSKGFRRAPKPPSGYGPILLPLSLLTNKLSKLGISVPFRSLEPTAALSKPMHDHRMKHRARTRPECETARLHYASFWALGPWACNVWHTAKRNLIQWAPKHRDSVD